MRVAREQEGVAMVEFALVLAPLLLIIFGFLQIGIAMHAKINSTHLTAEGARYIAVNQNPGGPGVPGAMENFIRNRAGTTFLKGAYVCIEYPNNPQTATRGRIGDPVRVTMSRDYPLIPLVSQTDLPVQSETTMRLEALPVRIPATGPACPT